MVQFDQKETKVWFQPKPKWGGSNHKSRSVSVQGSSPNPLASRGGGLQLPWDLVGHVLAAQVSAAIGSFRQTASERFSNYSRMGWSHTYVSVLVGGSVLNQPCWQGWHLPTFLQPHTFSALHTHPRKRSHLCTHAHTHVHIYITCMRVREHV